MFYQQRDIALTKSLPFSTKVPTVWVDYLVRFDISNQSKRRYRILQWTGTKWICPFSDDIICTKYIIDWAELPTNY